MQSDHLVMCGGLSSPATTPPSASTLSLDLWGLRSARNVFLEVGDIHGPLWSNMPRALHDLIEIATYVYVADQVSKRTQQDTDTFGAFWHRSFHFHIPVRCPDVWSAPAVTRQLCDTLDFLSDDRFTFTFHPAPKSPTFQMYLTGMAATIGRPEQVIMFSGGLDSLAGAVEESVNDKRKILLLNHRSTPKRAVRMRTLEKNLSRHAGKYAPSLLHIRASKDSDLTKDYTQRARSFLYASFGATVAHMLGLRSFRFYENGIVSLNLPVCAQVVGSRATRTTHPKVLHDYSKLFAMLTEQEFTVENPFIWHTKGDTVQAIMKAGCSDLIPLSTSCAHTWTTSNIHPHCGVCSQCIDRRLATVAVDAEQLDPVSGYKVDIFTQSRSKDDDKMMVAYFLERANAVGAIDDVLRFIEEYPNVTAALPHMDCAPTAAAEKILRLYKRHASEVTTALDIMTDRHRVALRQRTLPGDCVVRLVLDPHSATLVSTTVPPHPPVPDRPKPQEDPPDVDSKPAFLFADEGASYRVRVPEGEFTTPKRAGEQYLFWFARNPATLVRALDLVSQVRGVLGRMRPGDDDSEETATHLNTGVNVDATTTPESVERIRLRLKALVAERSRAERDGDVGHLDAINEEFEILEQQLGKDTDRFGRPRLLPAADGRAMLSIRKELNRCYRRILKGKSHTAGRRAFVNHFKDFISVDYQCEYRPPQDTHWKTSAT